MYNIRVRHHFETAHRLSHSDAPKKCQSIHGHSWQVTVVIESSQLDERGMIVEYNDFKGPWEQMLREELCHHLVVKRDDPIAQAIIAVQPDARILQLDDQPTTECLARWLYERASTLLAGIERRAAEARVGRIELRETSVNAASFEPGRSLS